MNNIIEFYCPHYNKRVHHARIADRVPDVEELNVTGGFNQVISCELLSDACPVRGDRHYDFYEIKEYLGHQNDDPDDVETNTDHYYIAVEYDFLGGEDE